MQATTRSYAFKPLNVGRILVWSLFALLLLLSPRIFTSGLSITMLSQMGIAIIACLSYNMLLGQGGMLSFGHAVYTGLGSYMAIHALNAAGAGTWPIPVSLIPLVGGVAGMGFAALLGYVTTRKCLPCHSCFPSSLAERPESRAIAWWDSRSLELPLRPLFRSTT
jgi:branched-chain amino acid transport system permease protein